MTCNPLASSSSLIVPYAFWCSPFSTHIGLLKIVPYSLLPQGLCQRRWWHPTPLLLPRKSHGRRSLVGRSPWGCWRSDTTERLHFHFSLSYTGEGNGNPLQYSCLENPRDGGAWWAAIHGVAQSRTQLMWLSSNSSSRPTYPKVKGMGKKHFATQDHLRQCERNYSHSYLLDLHVCCT